MSNLALPLADSAARCQHSALNLIAARDIWGAPQLWCRCGHVIECQPVRLWSGPIQTGRALTLWNSLAAQDTARKLIAGR